MFVTSDEIFSIRTHHKTKVFLDENCNVVHRKKPEQTDLPVFARLTETQLSFFVIKNCLAKYIRSIDSDGRASLAEERCLQQFTRNLLNNSLAVRQNERFWSAHKSTGRFWLAPKNSAWESFWVEPITAIESDATDVVLGVFDADELDETLERLKSDRLNIAAVLLDGKTDEELAALSEEKQLPCVSFTQLEGIAIDNRESLWLMNGCNDLERLRRCGVPRGNVIDITPKMRPSPQWLANVKAAAESDCDFIALGDLETALGLDLERIVDRKGISLAAEHQDLRQCLLTARYVLECNRQIKFILLGLTAASFCGEVAPDCRRVFSEGGNSFEERLFNSMFRSEPKFPTTLEPDPNLIEMKRTARQSFSIERQEDCGEINDGQLQQLEDFIAVCSEFDVMPIALLMPSLDSTYPIDKTNFARRMLQYMEKISAFKFIDLSTLPLGYEHFSNARCLNAKGAAAIGGVLDFRLRYKGVLPLESMRRLTYDRLYGLRALLSADEYNAMMSRIFEASVAEIKRKDRIKIGFVLFDSAMWCGDELFRLFERNERYEATVFFCLRPDEKTELTEENFHHGLELFRARGLRVEDMHDFNKKIPKQDVLIFLTPYFGYLTRAFRPNRLTAETLLTYIPYGFRTTYWNISKFKINFIAWKLFMDSKTLVQFISKNHGIDASRPVYSGLPKMDGIFSDSGSEGDFDWKMARPNAVKIVWAPHWSIKGFAYHRLATFQSNYKFLYEYAKNHPETSWVFKPHPQLLTSAVTTGVFPSTEAFRQYLQQWDELPNARVATGGWYQSIFESSDGMILDSGSFIAEYQYTHKPMLFLTRKGEYFSELGRAIIEANYHVDGTDFDGIAKFIEDVLIKRNDTQLEARNRVFDAELNYVKDNGMSASEMIFRTIDLPLREE